MSETAIRYLSMLRMVPRYPRSITAPELATRLQEQGFELGIRSIQRDLGKLSATFPLLSDESSRPFRWSYDAAASNNMIPALDMPAALTLELARAYLTPVLPQRALAHLRPHFSEAQETLGRHNHPLGRWPDRVRVLNRGLITRRPEIQGEVLETVTEALLTDQQCELTYQARNWPEARTIRVHPFGLIFRDPNVYLIATIEGREGVRQLVLHRASASVRVEAPVERPADFDLDKYILSGAMGLLHSQEPVYLKLRCDKPFMSHLIESPLGFDQLIEEDTDESFHLSVTVGDTQDLRWWLIAQAAHMDILAPEYLRECVLEELRKSVARQEGLETQASP